MPDIFLSFSFTRKMYRIHQKTNLNISGKLLLHLPRYFPTTDVPHNKKTRSPNFEFVFLVLRWYRRYPHVTIPTADRRHLERTAHHPTGNAQRKNRQEPPEVISYLSCCYPATRVFKSPLSYKHRSSSGSGTRNKPTLSVHQKTLHSNLLSSRDAANEGDNSRPQHQHQPKDRAGLLRLCPSVCNY